MGFGTKNVGFAAVFDHAFLMVQFREKQYSSGLWLF